MSLMLACPPGQRESSQQLKLSYHHINLKLNHIWKADAKSYTSTATVPHYNDEVKRIRLCVMNLCESLSLSLFTCKVDVFAPRFPGNFRACVAMI
jgi:hypothetical protein